MNSKKLLYILSLISTLFLGCSAAYAGQYGPGWRLHVANHSNNWVLIGGVVDYACWEPYQLSYTNLILPNNSIDLYSEEVVHGYVGCNRSPTYQYIDYISFGFSYFNADTQTGAENVISIGTDSGLFGYVDYNANRIWSIPNYSDLTGDVHIAMTYSDESGLTIDSSVPTGKVPDKIN